MSASEQAEDGSWTGQATAGALDVSFSSWTTALNGTHRCQSQEGLL